MKVYVAVHHNNTSDLPEHIRVFANRESALAWRLQIAVEDWFDELGPVPEDNDVLMDTYWDYVGAKEASWFHWDECGVEA